MAIYLVRNEHGIELVSDEPGPGMRTKFLSSVYLPGIPPVESKQRVEVELEVVDDERRPHFWLVAGVIRIDCLFAFHQKPSRTFGDPSLWVDGSQTPDGLRHGVMWPKWAVPKSLGVWNFSQPRPVVLSVPWSSF